MNKITYGGGQPRPVLLAMLGSLAVAALATTSAAAAVPPAADGPRTVAAPLATDTDSDSLPDSHR